MTLLFVPDFIMPPANVSVYTWEPTLQEGGAFCSVYCDGTEAGGVALDAGGSGCGGGGVLGGAEEGLVGVGWVEEGNRRPGSAGGWLVDEGPHCGGHDVAVFLEGKGVESVFDTCAEKTKKPNKSIHKFPPHRGRTYVP